MTEGEEDEEGEDPLLIPDLLSIPLTTQEAEPLSNEQSLESTSDRLERHLGTIIEETFQERTTLELE